MRTISYKGRNYLVLKDEYGRINNEQILIVAKSGWGKTLASQGIVEEFHKNGYLVLVIADPKNEFEFAFQMFESKEEYQKKHLNKLGKNHYEKKVKIYHPFTFNLPETSLPEMNLFTFSLKDLKKEEWSLIAETGSDRETIRLLLQASQNIGREDGIYGLAHYVQNMIKGKTFGGVRKSDPRNFFLEASAGTIKTVSEISTYLQPFKKDYFLTKDNCPLNLNWEEVLGDKEHYHVFVSKWVSDSKLRDFVVLALLEGIIRNRDYLKSPVVVVIPEIRKLCPFFKEGHKIFLAESIKNALSLMRGSAIGMSSVSDSQVWEDIDQNIRDSATITLLGQIMPGADYEKICKAFYFQREIKKWLKNPSYNTDNRNAFLPLGLKEEFEEGFVIFMSSSMNKEEKIRFVEEYKKHYSEKIRKYSETIKMMDIMYKEEHKKFYDEDKRKKKMEQEMRKKEEKEKEKTEEGKSDVENLKKKLEEKTYENKIILMKEIYDMFTDKGMSKKRIAEEKGLDRRTVRKYVEEYKKIKEGNGKEEKEAEVDRTGEEKEAIMEEPEEESEM